MFLKHTHSSVPPQLRDLQHDRHRSHGSKQLPVKFYNSKVTFHQATYSDLCFILPRRDLPEILVTHDQKYEMGITDQRGECLLIGLFQFATLKHDRAVRACLITPRHTMYCAAWALTHCHCSVNQLIIERTCVQSVNYALSQLRALFMATRLSILNRIIVLHEIIGAHRTII